MRLFVAVDLPDGAREELARLIAELRACRADVRWVKADALHLTMKFLGNVDAGEVGGVDAAIAQVAGTARPTRGRLRGIGSFPHPSRPRVLWAGVHPEGEALARLHDALEGALDELGFAREKRRFHPHVTLGRVRGGKKLGELRRALAEREDFDAGAVPIDALTLYESKLGRGGARYTPLARHRLGNDRTVRSST